MKKTIAFLLIALLTLSFSTAFADSVPTSKEDQMVGLVKSFLEESIFKTAETLENKGFLPFSYACLSLKSASRY